MNAWSAAMDVVQVLGWALLHFVWQAAVIAALYALLRRCLPRGEARYLLGMLALVALALCPLLTAWHLTGAAFATPETGATFATAIAAPPRSDHGSANNWQMLVVAGLPWLVLMWSCGVTFLSLRVWRHWRRLQALVRTSRAAPVWQERLCALAQHFGLRRGVRVLSSALIATPTLVGWIRPVILLPLAVSCGFPVAQVEMILAHELAHLRRFDHIANLFQVVLETVLFYHPAVHWISHDVRNERELCCDALTLRITGGSRHDYASALVELEEFRENHAGLTLAANGGVLLDRIGEITGIERDRFARRQPSRFIGALSGLTLAMLLLLLLLLLLWRQAGLRRELADSTAPIQQLTSHLLPASLRLPVQDIANLVPTRMTAAPTRMIAPLLMSEKTSVAESTSPQSHRLIIADPPLRITDFIPHRLTLTVPPRALPIAPEVPAPIHIEHPLYPLGALEQHIEGKVVMEFGLNSDGSVYAPVVVDAQPARIFDHAATHALLGWIFAVPAGADPNRRYRQTFTFTLHPDNEVAGKEIQAKAGCYTVTGSNICRSRTLGEAAAANRILH